jgi:hypothetical protein
MWDKQILPFFPAVLQIVIRSMFAVLNRSFRFFQDIRSGHLVIGLYLGQIDDFTRLYDKIRLVGSGVMIPIDMELFRCWTEPFDNVFVVLQDGGEVLLSLGIELIQGVTCLLES